VGGVKYLKLQAIPPQSLGGFILSRQSVHPYLYLGFGTLIYKRAIGGNVNVTEGKFKTSIHVPAGVALKLFSQTMSPSLLISATGSQMTIRMDSSRERRRVCDRKSWRELLLRHECERKSRLARARTRQTREATEAEVQRVKEAADAEALR